MSLNSHLNSAAVVKVRFKSIKRRKLVGRKVNVLTTVFRTIQELRKLRAPIRLHLPDTQECCSNWLQGHSKRSKFLVMGKQQNGNLVPTFIVPWTRNNVSSEENTVFQI